MTYPEAVANALKDSDPSKLPAWEAQARSLSLTEMRVLAKELGADVFFDWEWPRTVEGYYRLQNGLDLSVARATAYAKYADIVWVETSNPNYDDCKYISNGIHATYPKQMLAYNLSPSFNWDVAGMSDDEIASYVDDIAKLGNVWQFITVGGLHCSSLAITRFARDYAKRKMLAYVETIQRAEREEAVETLMHQKWSGAAYWDAVMQIGAVTESSVTALGKGDTEGQFSS